MTKTEHLLICLIEECGEVIHAASKALRFGLDDINPESHATNAEDITSELNDVTAIQKMLRNIQAIPEMANANQRQYAKRERVVTYLEYARLKGIITDK